MRKQQKVSEVRDRSTDKSADMEHANEQGSAVRALTMLAAVFVVVVAGGVLMASCSKQGDSATQASSTGSMSSPEASQQTSVASAVPTTRVQSGLSAADTATLEGLPPDLSVSVPDTLVKPGQSVEFTVDGTADVSQVALSDGRDDPMPFVRDAGKDTWRTQYRVPLHPRYERFGVSVTAKTDANRWRRVWVFLHVSQGDSTKVVTSPEEEENDCE